MVATPESQVKSLINFKVTWEKLPEGYQLEEEPVDNTGQPLLAGALRESLELAGLIQPEMLIASNFGLCATLNEELIIKAPDWVYVAKVNEILVGVERKSYTPNLDGEVPFVVMEFLSDTDGSEYSVKRTFPPGKWFFYEHVLQVPNYVIFEPESGLLEVYRLQSGRYELEQPDFKGRHWFEDLKLFLGTWRGEKEGRNGYWLRWWDAEENLLLWGCEQVALERLRAEQERQRAEQERQRAEQERQRAEQERQRAEKLAKFLRSQNINPEDIP